MPDQTGMITRAPNGTPITPYSAAGLVTAMRPDHPAPVTPMTEVPGVSIVRKRVDSQGNIIAVLSDGTEKKLDRQPPSSDAIKALVGTLANALTPKAPQTNDLGSQF